MDGAALIAAQAQCLTDDFSLQAVTAAEIEFYLHGAEACPELQPFWQDVLLQSEQRGIALFKTDKETGREQFEAALKPATPGKTAADVKILKNIIASVADKHAMQ